MPKTNTFGSLALKSSKEIFKSTTTMANGEHVVEIPLSELYPPEFHPFQVNDDLSMTRLVKSIKQYGVREPGLARPREDGGYELIAGNRRKRACEIAGLTVMPVIVRKGKLYGMLDKEAYTLHIKDGSNFRIINVPPGGLELQYIPSNGQAETVYIPPRDSAANE